MSTVGSSRSSSFPFVSKECCGAIGSSAANLLYSFLAGRISETTKIIFYIPYFIYYTRISGCLLCDPNDPGRTLGWLTIRDRRPLFRNDNWWWSPLSSPRFCFSQTTVRSCENSFINSYIFRLASQFVYPAKFGLMFPHKTL